MPAYGVRSLDKCWAAWATVTTPPLPGTLFSSAIEEGKRKLAGWLGKPPAEPLVIAADSTDEALAFVARCFGPDGGAELEPFRDQVLVFDNAGMLPKLADGTRPFIPVVHSRDVAVELAPLVKQMHCVLIYPRNAVNSTPDIVLEPISAEVFEFSLKGVGKNRDEIKLLANESGRSLTVLRRRLATVEEVRTPLWATQPSTPERLIQFMLVGAWNATNETDKTALSRLAGDYTFDELEKECQRLVQLNDAPLWSIGAYRGVVSKIDLLYAIARYLTRDDLKRYFEVARLVLGEDDPSLDLADDQRWAASIHGKKREFSSAFRQGIGETLVLLAVHGPRLFKSRLGIDTETEAALVVRELLTPLNTRVLEANDHDLPLYAEAAPQEFISIIERDLKSTNPATFGLMRAPGSGVFSSPSRTGLLWALEGIAWNPDTLPGAVMILARLAQIEINDNWKNKPDNSLSAIFCAWMPQTAAGHDDRLALIKTLFRRFPDVAWALCVSQFGGRNRIGHYNHKPIWRSDGYGVGEPLSTWGPVDVFVDAMVELALTRDSYSRSMLSDLIDRLHDLSDTHQDQVWLLVNMWAETASDKDKIALREKIRVSTLSRRAAVRVTKSGKQTRVVSAAKRVYAALEPTNLVDKYAWLFKGTWIEESADELEDVENIDYDQRERRIRDQRIYALKEIHRQYGSDGLLNIAAQGGTAGTIGALATEFLLTEEDLLKLVERAFQNLLVDTSSAHASEWLIQGVLEAMSNDTKRSAFLESIVAKMSIENAIFLLKLAPFNEATWELIEAMGEAARERYWKEVTVSWIRESGPTLTKAVRMLMNVYRSRAAFAIVKDHPAKLDIRTLFELLTMMAREGNDKPGEYMLEHYYVEKAFKCIGNASELSLEQKAGLEFDYIDVLARSGDRKTESQIPHIELYIEAHPEFLAEAISWTYKRTDGTMDPPEIMIPADRVKTMAERGYILIDALKRIPGTDDVAEINGKRLAEWVRSVRESCADMSRGEIADVVIGGILSSAPVGKDGAWPCEPVRELMEDLQSEHMMSGAHTGVYNSRGAHVRGPGGDQERALAERYRKWAQQIRASSPFVASKLLMKLTDTYDKEAAREDTEAKLNQRLQ